MKPTSGMLEKKMKPQYGKVYSLNNYGDLIFALGACCFARTDSH